MTEPLAQGVASAAALRRRGLTRADVDSALASGAIRRLRRGWYADWTARPDVVGAVQAGGRLSCVSLLRAHGAWTLDDGSVYVRVAKGATPRRGAHVRLHWTREPLDPNLAVDDLEDALRVAVHCLDLRHLIAVVDSVLNSRLLREEVVERVLLATPRGRQAWSRVDGRAESGIETFARLALRRAGVRVRSQVEIAGIGRVDLLVGDRLVVELDGESWHGGSADFERDRARDRALLARGYLVVRASYRQVMDELPLVTSQILAIVRRDEHLWRAIHPARRAETGHLRGSELRSSSRSGDCPA